TEEGYSLRLTADHRVMTDDGWVEAGELDAGDTVHIQNRKGSFGQHGSAAEGRTLGWLVGDGHLKHGEERAVLNFYDEDEEVAESFATDVNEVVREPTGNADYEVGVSEISRGDDYRGAGAVEQRVRSARLYEYAEQAELTEEKLQVPDAVMRGSEEMARGFLQALFTADGGVQGKTEKGNSVRLTSVSTDLLADVQRLLLNFGIASKLYEERHEAGEQEMPDGNGGTATYERQADHDLVIAKDNLARFQQKIGFLLDSKNEALAERLDSYDRGPYSEQFEATVESVDHDGHETVYDLTEPDTNSFVANGLVVHNCGEQPLEEYEACNLGHINLSTLAAEDAPDWRVWSEEHADEYDSQADAVDAFLEEALDYEEFDDRIAYGTRFLENVVTMSDFPVDKIEQKVRDMRKIGLGVMGLAQLYVQLGIRYGTDEGNEVARQLMTHINHGSKWTSHELAEERGSFNDWDDSKY
ncbi:LAGLIDADG family homing endonuclease, partial [Haloparvum sedimenti]|uniref:LAGLIDADG family homing endonuclease n=1 Tax=Haloparvum sedimenti TaxID=1678448 RepID=UPI000A7C7BA8